MTFRFGFSFGAVKKYLATYYDSVMLMVAHVTCYSILQLAFIRMLPADPVEKFLLGVAGALLTLLLIGVGTWWVLHQRRTLRRPFDQIHRVANAVVFGWYFVICEALLGYKLYAFACATFVLFPALHVFLSSGNGGARNTE